MIENLRLKISTEKSTDKELDVIDIIEREVDLIDKHNLIIICKSETKGNHFLPRLTITDESTKKSYNYDKLINLNIL